MITLRPLQRRLENIYEVAAGHDIDDFVITDSRLAARLHGGRQANEKLLIREHRDGVDLALYLDRALVGRLAADSPTAALHDGNLPDFCVALEGVSHFLCLLWNARRRPVSRLELELQAEVDKYILAAGLIGKQRAGRMPRGLHRLLFENFTLAPELDPDEKTRYRDANRYAGKYCRRLEDRYFKRLGGRSRSLLSELRGFYRLPLQAKLRRIEQPG